MSETRQACPIPYALTPAQVRVLIRAYRRPEGVVCPCPGLWAASQMAVLRALVRSGYITGDGSPVLTENGRLVAADLIARQEATVTNPVT